MHKPPSFRKLKKFKVLLGTPTAESKNYCLEDWLERAQNLTYRNYDMFIVDNSKTEKNAKMFRGRGIDCAYVNPKGLVNQQYVADSLELIRKRAIDGNYDFLFILESDVIPPSTIIDQLLINNINFNIPIVSASYFVGTGHKSALCYQEVESFGELRYSVNVDDHTNFAIADGKLKRVSHCGIGCILIHRSVFTKIPFRWEDGAVPHPDSFFAADCLLEGIPIHLDTSIICEHRNQSWAFVDDAVMTPDDKIQK